jgi:hypothetical protein
MGDATPMNPGHVFDDEEEVEQVVKKGPFSSIRHVSPQTADFQDWVLSLRPPMKDIGRKDDPSDRKGSQDGSEFDMGDLGGAPPFHPHPAPTLRNPSCMRHEADFTPDGLLTQ